MRGGAVHVGIVRQFKCPLTHKLIVVQMEEPRRIHQLQIPHPQELHIQEEMTIPTTNP